ncbi:MAG: TolC family protein [Candidatus Omnitrophica bacterium]|nr:TolC family protein [Candidatus Omnitrophota bacterium]
MQRRIIYIMIILLLSFGLKSAFSFDIGQPAPNTSPLTLVECYNLTLKQSEKIGINTELIKEAQARFSQAMGTLMPHVTFYSENSWKDALDSGGTSVSSGGGLEQRFNFQQTLFKGFREFAAMKGAKFEQAQRINEKLRAEQLLLLDVTNSFYLLLEEKDDLNSLLSIKKALINRIHDLMDREKLGRSRRSEVVSTESELYSVNADIELAKSRVILARQMLEFLTGVTITEVIDSDKDFPILDSEESYLANSGVRPDVLATENAWEVSKQNKKIAVSGLLPEITVEGNIYTHRIQALEGSTWDAALNVSIPIFEGTEVYGLIQEAAIKATEAELEYRHTRRKTYADIRDAYVKIQTGIPRTLAFKKALMASEMNYTLQKSDYKLNLVNNLDVLAAIRTLENTRRNFINSYYTTKRSYWQLQVAVGQLKAGEIK